MHLANRRIEQNVILALLALRGGRVKRRTYLVFYIRGSLVGRPVHAVTRGSNGMPERYFWQALTIMPKKCLACAGYHHREVIVLP